MMSKANVLIALLLLAGSANAALVSHDFTVEAGGHTAAGSIAYDDAIVAQAVASGPLGILRLDGIDLLTDLQFHWNGITYDEHNTRSGFMMFDPKTKRLNSIHFGSNCNIAPGCPIVTGDEEGWNAFATAEFGDPWFFQGGIGPSGTIQMTGLARIPEPAPLLLLLANLAVIWYRARYPAWS